MKFIQGQDRFQTSLFPVSLDSSIDQDNEIRLIDLFVEGLELKPLGFDVDYVDNGRPAVLSHLGEKNEKINLL